MSHRTRTLLTAIAAWHLACLAMMFVYKHAIGHLVVAIYTAWFGDVQASYGRFHRIATYSEFFVTTWPATLVSLLLFDRLCRRPTNGKWTLLVLSAWHVVVVAVLICSYEVALPEIVMNQLDVIFGPSYEVYSFRNLVLPRIMAWLICTTPVAWIALWVFSKRP